MVFEYDHFLQIKAHVVHAKRPSLFAEFPRTTAMDPGMPDPQEKIIPLVPGFRATGRDSRRGQWLSNRYWDTALSRVAIFVSPSIATSNGSE